MEASAALICNQFIGAASFSFFTLKSLRFPSVPVLHSEYGAVRDETSSFPAETFKSKQEVPGSGTAPPGRSCTCRMDTHTHATFVNLCAHSQSAQTHAKWQGSRWRSLGRQNSRGQQVLCLVLLARFCSPSTALGLCVHACVGKTEHTDGVVSSS